MTEEENGTENPGQAPQERTPDLGKFQSVDALMRAYQELEAAFSRRSQRLRALEAAAPQGGNAGETRAQTEELPDEALLRAVRGNEEVRARIVGEYLASLGGVPLLAGSGAGITAPAQKATTFRQAGALALGYLKHRKQGG